MNFIEDKIRISLELLHSRVVNRAISVPEMGFARCAYKTENVPAEDLQWETYHSGDPVRFQRDTHAWLTFSMDIPECGENEAWFLRFTTGKERQWDSVNPQCTVFINGDSSVHAFDTNHTEMLLTPGHKDIRIYFFGGMSDAVLFLNASAVCRDLRVEKLCYDISVPFEAMKCMNKNSHSYNRICRALDQACMFLDFRDRGSAEFSNGIEEAIAFLEEEFYGKLCGKNEDGEIALIGHTHIDVAYRWTIAQTVEKVQRSFSTAIALMEQYPDYIFMSSQPQLYRFLKDTDPALYEKVKARAAEGRWETEGAMWLESDTNLVSGESLIRQILYGKKFMKEEFGAENHILWLPDVFGYSAALPQILKKCGVDQFFTTKIAWSETDDFPHDHFTWEGIDGSQVFAVLSDAYVKDLNPEMIKRSLDKHKDKKYSDVHLSTFGFGDGGGGPTKEMLENYERLKRGIPGFPKVTMRPAAEILAEIQNQFSENTKRLRFEPKWVGELYLELHRGTYTTMAENKKNNRRAEFLYQKAETSSVLANVLTGAKYPVKQLEDGWMLILKNQFHDIIPGSSIKEVFDLSRQEYAEVLASGEEMFKSALDTLAENIQTDGGWLVYNPTSFTRSETVFADGKEFAVQDIPPHGYAVVQAETVEKPCVTADGNTIENECLRVAFDSKYHIVSVYDKRAEREVIEAGQCANVLEVFEDYPKNYDAWEITEYYKQKKWIADDVSDVEVLQNTLSAGFRITRKYGKSTIIQKITLRAGSARLDFETDIDWNEDHVLLKAAFPLDIRAQSASYEIQFGHLERPTHRNTSWDQAKFEVCAHKWADLSENGYGAAILNDCKYGYSTEGNVMKISLLKAPTEPNPVADRGHHHFTYALYPHVGALNQSGVVREAYCLNQPLTVCSVGANSNGKLPVTFSLCRTDCTDAVIETCKQAEDGKGYIIRLYEAAGGKCRTTLQLGFNAAEVYLCDMIENNTEKLAVSGYEIPLTLSNFEVKTLRVIPQ